MSGGITRGTVGVDPERFTTALDYDGANNPIYIGMALPGSLKSDPVWQIRKLIFDGANNLLDMQFADGKRDFHAIWNNRTGLAYS